MHFYYPIFTPVYRIVDKADSVPRTPLGFGTRGLVFIIKNIPIPYAKKLVNVIDRKFAVYEHHGNHVYIIPKKKILFILKKSPNAIRVFYDYTTKAITSTKDLANYHRISNYVDALDKYAKQRMKERK